MAGQELAHRLRLEAAFFAIFCLILLALVQGALNGSVAAGDTALAVLMGFYIFAGKLAFRMKVTPRQSDIAAQACVTFGFLIRELPMMIPGSRFYCADASVWILYIIMVRSTWVCAVERKVVYLMSQVSQVFVLHGMTMFQGPLAASGGEHKHSAVTAQDIILPRLMGALTMTAFLYCRLCFLRQQGPVDNGMPNPVVVASREVEALERNAEAYQGSDDDEDISEDDTDSEHAFEQIIFAEIRSIICARRKRERGRAKRDLDNMRQFVRWNWSGGSRLPALDPKVLTHALDFVVQRSTETSASKVRHSAKPSGSAAEDLDGYTSDSSTGSLSRQWDSLTHMLKQW